MENKAVHYCDGMRLFGDALVKYYGYKKYNPNTDQEMPTLFEGLYFQQDYNLFIKHKGERTVYWNGSDVYRLLDNPVWIKTLQEIPAKHLCGSAEYVKELATVGIKGKHHPLFFDDITSFEPSYKQADIPNVYMTAHPGREKEYGVDVAISLTKQVDFHLHIYGLVGVNTDRVTYHGHMEPDEMNREIKEFQCSLKLNPRNGISQTIAKSALLAQYPISINLIEGVWYAPDKIELVKCLKLLKDQKEPNYALREKYLDVFKPGI